MMPLWYTIPMIIALVFSGLLFYFQKVDKKLGTTRQVVVGTIVFLLVLLLPIANILLAILAICFLLMYVFPNTKEDEREQYRRPY